MEQLIEKSTFNVVGLNNQTLIADNFDVLIEFRKEIAETKRIIDGAGKLLGENNEKIKLIEYAVKSYPNADINLLTEIEALKMKLNKCSILLWGDHLKSEHEFETTPSIAGRIGTVYYQTFSNTTSITQTQRDNKLLAEEQYKEFRVLLNDAIVRIKGIEQQLEKQLFPTSKGRTKTGKKTTIRID